MGQDVLLGFAEPKVYTAGLAITAGQLVKMFANNTVVPTSSGVDVVAGVALIDAISGATVTIMHAVWVRGVPNATGVGVGPVAPSSTTSGALKIYTKATDEICGFAKDSGLGEVYIY